MANTVDGIVLLGTLVKKYAPKLSFSLLEIGAVPLEEEEEPFYKLLDIFPESKLSAFELDEAMCADLNKKARPNITYYPVAVGGEDGTQPFYETNAPICSSLYKPNDALLNHFNNLEMSMLKTEGTMRTECLDSFVKNNDISSIDFIKLDIQGAELDVFKGGNEALRNTVFIVCEVEFIPLYVDQPLFGDVCKYLTSKDLAFHKFLDFGGRAIKPVIMQNNVNIPTQLMWSDAIFIKDLDKLSSLSSESLLKLSILALIYDSPDLTFRCFQIYDDRENTNIQQEYMKLWGG